MSNEERKDFQKREDLLETLAILTSKSEKQLTKKTTPQLKTLLQKALDNA